MKALVGQSADMNTSPDEQRACTTSNGDDPSSFSPPLYSESYRPQIHYSPSSGFMNDPNGLLKSGDTWHMYYQYNPTGTKVGNQHWGHASSKDLYTWTNHLPAISPANPDEAVFSGSAILDVNNTSQLFRENEEDSTSQNSDSNTDQQGRFVAIYTLNTPTDQNQNIAHSTDGSSYIKYGANPVISLNGSTAFRDPKVFWSASQSEWIMTVAHATDYQVGFYGSADLKSWRELSRFTPPDRPNQQPNRNHSSTDLVELECPDLLEVPIEGGPRDGQTAWLLVYSINPGLPGTGAGVLYYTGHWDGQRFTADRDSSSGGGRSADFGIDWYAPQSFFQSGDRESAPSPRRRQGPIVIGWASNWLYTNEAPTSPYRGVMSVPRELKLVWSQLAERRTAGEWQYQLAQLPYNLEALPSRALPASKQTITDPAATTATTTTTRVALEGNGAFEIRAIFSRRSRSSEFGDVAKNSTTELEILDENGTGSLKIGFAFDDDADAGHNQSSVVSLYVDRSSAGAEFRKQNPSFKGRFTRKVAPLIRLSSDSAHDDADSSTATAAVDHLVELQIIVDRTITEVFAQRGIASCTVLTYWDANSKPASLNLKLADSSTVKLESMDVRAIQGTWPACPAGKSS